MGIIIRDYKYSIDELGEILYNELSLEDLIILKDYLKGAGYFNSYEREQYKPFLDLVLHLLGEDTPSTPAPFKPVSAG